MLVSPIDRSQAVFNKAFGMGTSCTQCTFQCRSLSEARYLKGVDSYLSALDAQRSYYSAQQGLVSLRLAVATHGAVGHHPAIVEHRERGIERVERQPRAPFRSQKRNCFFQCRH